MVADYLQPSQFLSIRMISVPQACDPNCFLFCWLFPLSAPVFVMCSNSCRLGSDRCLGS